MTTLARLCAVPKAATSSSGSRPKAKAHFDSLKNLDLLNLPSKVTLIDDVITRGAQMLGAAWRIWAARPDIEIRGFAVIRTISTPDRFVGVLAPCNGWVQCKADECFREP